MDSIGMHRDLLQAQVTNPFTWHTLKDGCEPRRFMCGKLRPMQIKARRTPLSGRHGFMTGLWAAQANKSFSPSLEGRQTFTRVPSVVQAAAISAEECPTTREKRDCPGMVQSIGSNHAHAMSSHSA